MSQLPFLSISQNTVTKMDIAHLAEDELKFELILREINPKDRDALSKLKDMVAFEATSGTTPQFDSSARLTRNTVDRELQ